MRLFVYVGKLIIKQDYLIRAACSSQESQQLPSQLPPPPPPHATAAATATRNFWPKQRTHLLLAQKRSGLNRSRVLELNTNEPSFKLNQAASGSKKEEIHEKNLKKKKCQNFFKQFRRDRHFFDLIFILCSVQAAAPRGVLQKLQQTN